MPYRLRRNDSSFYAMFLKSLHILNQEQLILLSCLIVLSLLSIGFDFFAPLYLAIIPSIFFIKLNRNNLLAAAPLIFALGLMVTVLNAVVLDTLSIHVVSTNLVFAAFVEAALIIALSKRFKPVSIPTLNWPIISLIYLLFFLVLWSRVFSVLEHPAPILHDPISHAYWAKSILDNKSLDYFYSPGLHLWIGLLSNMLNVSVAQATNIMTNIFSALSVLFWGTSFAIISKKSRVGLWISIVMVISPMPAVLYFEAGKNSLVAAFCLIPLLFIFAKEFCSTQKITQGLLVALALTGLGLFHYPMFAYGVVGYFIYALITFNWSKQPRVILSRFIIILSPVLLSGLIIGGFLILSKLEDPQPAQISRQKAAELQRNAESSPLFVPEDETGIDRPDEPQITINNPVQETKKTTVSLLELVASTSGKYGLLFVGVAITATLALLIEVINRKSHEAVVLVALTSSSVIIAITLNVVGISQLKTVGDTGLFIVLPFMLAGIFIILERAPKILLWPMVICGLVLCSVFAQNTFETYQQRTLRRQVIDLADIEAFQWINYSLQGNLNFIGMSQHAENRPSVIYPIDGSAWIPVYTNHDIATPFQEVRFNKVDANINYIYYRKLISDNESSVLQAVNYFVDNGYDYIYLDRNISENIFNPEQILIPRYAEKIYENTGVSILKLSSTSSH